MSLLRFAPLLLLVVLTAGCVSTQDRYDDARELAEQNRWAEAARRYVDVLEREAGFRDARARLDTTGRQAVGVYLEHARRDEAAGRYEAASEALADLDALRLDAEQVGVLLPVPVDYAAFRDEVTQAAIAALMERGERAERRGAWTEALDAYERAQERYPLSTAQRQAFDEARVRTLLRWGDAEMEAGRFRAAFGRAAEAVDLVGPRHPLAAEAGALQEDALALGTVPVAFVPFGFVAEASPPHSFARDLDDVLLYEYWSALPPFLALADPVETRRLLRRHYDERRPLDRREAARLGRAVDAALVVLGDVTGFEWVEDDLDEEVRRVELAARGRTANLRRDTVFVVQRYDLELEAEVDYRIVDVATRRVVDQGTVRADVEGPMVRGVYDGDPETLALARRDRDLFDPVRQQEAEQVLIDELVDALAARIAEQVTGDAVRLVP